jgi:hypothetical protein
MTHLSQRSRAAALQRLSVLCALLAAASVHAAGGIRDPPSGVNGWTPAVPAPAQMSAPAAAAVRTLPKSGR